MSNSLGPERKRVVFFLSMSVPSFQLLHVAFLSFPACFQLRLYLASMLAAHLADRQAARRFQTQEQPVQRSEQSEEGKDPPAVPSPRRWSWPFLGAFPSFGLSSPPRPYPLKPGSDRVLPSRLLCVAALSALGSPTRPTYLICPAPSPSICSIYLYMIRSLLWQIRAARWLLCRPILFLCSLPYNLYRLLAHEYQTFEGKS